jgi:hypothetical protein
MGKLKRLETFLRKKYVKENKNFSFRRDRSRSYQKIRAIVTALRNESLDCAEDRSRCVQIEVPKARLERIFFTAFRPRPPKGRNPMRRLRAQGQRDFRAILITLPDYVVTCE